MKDIINASDIQRKGWKDVYKVIEQYGHAYIVNQRNEDVLVISKENKSNEGNSVDSTSLPSIIKKLRSIKKELQEKYKVGNIGICGSFVRGENTTESDLDIVVDYIPNDFGVWFEIEEYISKVTHVKKIDLLEKKSIRPFAWDTIQEEIIYV